MQVGQVQDGVTIERQRKFRDRHVMFAKLDLQCVAFPALAQAERGQNHPDQVGRRVPVFQMKEMRAAAEDLCLVVVLQAQSLLDVKMAEAGFEGGALVRGQFG